jgi:hypothetical protein
MRSGLAIDFAHAPAALDGVYFHSLSDLDVYLRSQSRALAVVEPQACIPVVQNIVKPSAWDEAMAHFAAGVLILWLAVIASIQLAITQVKAIAVSSMSSLALTRILGASGWSYAIILTALLYWR